jgi:Na+/H+ antiporter NhaA
VTGRSPAGAKRPRPLRDSSTSHEPAAAPGGHFSELTLWPRVAGPLRSFLRAETAGAVVMLGATVAALVWANAPSASYESFWTTTLSLRIGHNAISQDLRHWVNGGLMTLFFLVVGLEARRELQVGQLRQRWTLRVPLIASIGGMAVPIAIYLLFNASGPGAHGWGAAMSTDTAFLLGVLSLVAPSGTRLRVRLLTLALFDDVAALVVIATVYPSRFSLAPLLVAIGLFGALAGLRHAPEGLRGGMAAIVGVSIWVALYESGIDPVVGGLAIGLVMSAHVPRRASLGRAVEHIRQFREQPTPQMARTARRTVAAAISPNERLESALHPWTSYVVVPLFALANAGIRLNGDLLSRAVRSPIALGIFVGYVLGKPIGIASSASLAVRLGVGRRALSTPAIVGGGIVAGIGFTVPLLITSLVFHGDTLQEAKVGILASAMVASTGGLVAFRVIARLPAALHARQLARTADDIVDLSDDVDPDRDHIRGGPHAGVTVVEYGDYECPFCGQAESVVRELLLSFGGDLRYVWRHLPLTDVHPQAQIAAEAAEAAGAQGAFWAMHDKLISHRDTNLSTGDLARYAEALQLDTGRFLDDLRSGEFAQRVAEDLASADASGVVGTPSFFINGKRHRGAYDIEGLTSAVQAAEARAAAAYTQLPGPAAMHPPTRSRTTWPNLGAPTTAQRMESTKGEAGDGPANTSVATPVARAQPVDRTSRSQIRSDATYDEYGGRR